MQNTSLIMRMAPEALLRSHPRPSHCPPPLSPPANISVFCFCIWLFQRFYINGLKLCGTLRVWLFSLSIIFWGFIQIVAGIPRSFLLYHLVVSHSMDVPQFICHSTMGGHVSCFQLLTYKWLFKRGCTISHSQQ